MTLLSKLYILDDYFEFAFVLVKSAIAAASSYLLVFYRKLVIYCFFLGVGELGLELRGYLCFIGDALPLIAFSDRLMFNTYSYYLTLVSSSFLMMDDCFAKVLCNS